MSTHICTTPVSEKCEFTFTWPIVGTGGTNIFSEVFGGGLWQFEFGSQHPEKETNMAQGPSPNSKAEKPIKLESFAALKCLVDWKYDYSAIYSLEIREQGGKTTTTGKLDVHQQTEARYNFSATSGTHYELRAIVTEISAKKQNLSLSILSQEKVDFRSRLLRLCKSFQDPSNSDVVFVFGNSNSSVAGSGSGTGQPFRRLYAGKRFLMEMSPYFETMFNSGFAESEPSKQSSETTDCDYVHDIQSLDKELDDNQSEGVQGDENQDDNGYDSDDDGLCPSFEEDTEGERKSFSDQAKHVVPVKHTKYRTYRALLWYLMTGEIEYSHLRSSERARIQESEGVDPGPLFTSSLKISSNSASPKSIYTLADVHGLKDLRANSLRAFRERLTAQNVLYEFFSDASERHWEILVAAKDFILRNWNGVKTTPAWKDLGRYLKLAGENQCWAWHEICSSLVQTLPGYGVAYIQPLKMEIRKKST